MAHVRTDLLALTDAAIVALSNRGFFNRAQKELSEGKVPAVAVGDDGVLVATFADGVTSKLIPGRALKDCPCSCGAASVCRHRVAAILAYQRQQAGAVAAASSTSASSTSASPTSASPTSASPAEAAGAPSAAPKQKKPWSPGEIDDAALEKLLGRAALERARTLRRRGVLAEVVRGTFEGDSLPRAKLQTSTVTFLVPGDASYAKCDCRMRTGCEHVAVAVWAFRIGDEKDRAALSQTVEVADRTVSSDERRQAALDGTRELAAQVVLEGVTRLSAAAAGRFALTKTALERARLAWPLAVVEDVEDLLDAYRRRSARYSPERATMLLAEVFARARAGEGQGDLPSSLVLGSDVALEADLDQLRLAALGARVEEDGERRVVSVFLADPSSQTVLVLQRGFEPVDGKSEDGPSLARRSAVSGSPLSMVAAAQLVSNAAKRRANRLLSFGVGALKKTSVLAGGLVLTTLPDSLVVRDGPAFVAQLASEPPRFLRPRLLAEHVRAFAISKVETVAYDEGEQAVRAACLDAAGHRFFVELAYRSVAPAALQALAQHLADGKATAVVGDGRNAGGDLVVEPVAVLAERLVVLDLEAPSDPGAAALAALPHAAPRAPGDLLERSVAGARLLIAEAAHQGLRTLTPTWSERLRGARAQLREAGFSLAADTLGSLDLAAAAARTTGNNDDEALAVERWVDAALRLELIADRL
ncbi:MAG TPA: hypothetical protein VGK67_21905 [Myxococcales bacterium]|jgi:hypothetical protein